MSDMGHGRQCRSCGARVRSDLVDHAFFGFAAGCSHANAAPKGVAFERAPEHDRRVDRGDGFAGDAWRNRDTGVLRHVSIGCDPNN